MQKKTDRKIRDKVGSEAKGKRPYVQPELVKKEKLTEVEIRF